MQAHCSTPATPVSMQGTWTRTRAGLAQGQALQ